MLLAALLAAAATSAPLDVSALPGNARKLTLKVLVSQEGTVKECSIERSSGDPKLDSGMCDTYKAKARYNPKLDEAGKPIEFEHRPNITLVIEE